VRSRARSRRLDRYGDIALYVLCAFGAIVVVVVMLEIAYQVIHGASAAMSAFGLGFLTHAEWVPNFGHMAAGSLLYGTIVTSLMAMVLGAPIAIAIALYLALIAPKAVRGIVGTLVEMLAAIPSVILGLWGIIALAPLLSNHVEPFLHSVFGFLPIFGPGQTSGSSLFAAGLILTIMVVPIIASVSRDLFLTVPQELQDGAAALGATRWEIVRGVVLPSTISGVTAACLLGLGRALGEAIAVTQLIGAGIGIHGASLFQTGDTLASRIASQFPGETSLQTSSLFYCAVILLVLGAGTNLMAQWISRRFDPARMAGR
jgi:phosphate transport system permease protein